MSGKHLHTTEFVTDALAHSTLAFMETTVLRWPINDVIITRVLPSTFGTYDRNILRQVAWIAWVGQVAVFEIITICGQVCEKGKKKKRKKENTLQGVGFVKKYRTIVIFLQQLAVFDVCTIFNTRKNFSTVQKVSQPFSGQFLLLSFIV